MRISPSLASVTLALAAVVLPSFGSPAAPPGPGAAIVAVERFLAAQDKGDIDELIACFDGKAEAMVGYDLKDGERKNFSGPSPMPWCDIDRDGKPLHAAKPDFLLKMISGHTGKRTILKLRADCRSPECSIATVDFTWTRRERDTDIVLPVRATALLRYDAKETRFRLFHWHASLAPTK